MVRGFCLKLLSLGRRNSHLVRGPLILPCFLSLSRVSGVGFSPIDCAGWVPYYGICLDRSYWPVGFWVLGGNFVLSLSIHWGRNWILLHGVLLVGMDVLLTLLRHLYQYMLDAVCTCMFEVCLWFTFQSVLITQITCVVRYDHNSLGLIFDCHVVLCKLLQSDLFIWTRLIFVLETFLSAVCILPQILDLELTSALKIPYKIFSLISLKLHLKFTLLEQAVESYRCIYTHLHTIIQILLLHKAPKLRCCHENQLCYAVL